MRRRQRNKRGERTDVRIYNDFKPGQVFQLGPIEITERDIISFAEKYDPQPFHLDPGSAQAESVGGLIASGWHTCSILMRMTCDSFALGSASLGSGGLDEIRWLSPVRPGDILQGQATVTERRPSKTRSNLGILVIEYLLENQEGENVLFMKGNGLISRTVNCATSP